jgi:hypothetical protein
LLRREAEDRDVAMRSVAYRSRSTEYASKRPTLARVCRAVKKSLLM